MKLTWASVRFQEGLAESGRHHDADEFFQVSTQVSTCSVPRAGAGYSWRFASDLWYLDPLCCIHLDIVAAKMNPFSKPWKFERSHERRHVVDAIASAVGRLNILLQGLAA